MNDRLGRFKARLEHDVLSHPIIVANPYTAWFKRGDVQLEHKRARF